MLLRPKLLSVLFHYHLFTIASSCMTLRVQVELLGKQVKLSLPFTKEKCQVEYLLR